MSDIEKSFAFLHDNIPQWLQDITELEEKVTAMQQDVIRTPTSTSPFAQRKTDSTKSIKQDRMGAIAEDDAPSQTDPLAGRKRKTLSVSSRASGSARYRRTMVVIEYDGDVQKSFESLVRSIGTGRNMLRKAKMEAKMNELAALARPSDDEDEADDDEDEAIMAKISYRPRMTSMRTRAAARQTPGSGAVTPAALFDTTDKTLEQAQVFCEKAAHVLLRDGDCRTELGGMRKNFSDVLETAKIEVTKCNAVRTLQPQVVALHDTSESTPSPVDPPYKKHFPQLSRPPHEDRTKAMLPSAPLVVAPTNSSKVMEIEVDDDDDDEDEPDFVMPVRFTSRFAARA